MRLRFNLQNGRYECLPLAPSVSVWLPAGASAKMRAYRARYNTTRYDKWITITDEPVRIDYACDGFELGNVSGSGTMIVEVEHGQEC